MRSFFRALQPSAIDPRLNSASTTRKTSVLPAEPCGVCKTRLSYGSLARSLEEICPDVKITEAHK